MAKQILIGLFFATPSLFTLSGAFAADSGYAPLVSEVNGVKVTARLLDTAPNAKTWNIELTLDTHTRPLDETLDTTSVLMVGKQQFFALGWQGSPPGGHHRTGVLSFRPIVPKPAAVELRILLNGESRPRSYSWRLK